MFSIGEKIVYGSEGVYTVFDYSGSPIDKNDNRSFYVLHPLYGPKGNIIYTPIENSSVKMRSVMSSEDALALIDSMPDLPLLTVENEKKRREVYRLALSECSVHKQVSIIKTVASRRTDMINQKKRLSESDADYEKKAKFCLYGELSIALNITFEEVEDFISKRLSAISI